MANESSFAQQIRSALQGSVRSMKKAAGVEGAEEGVKLETISSPEAGEQGVVSDVTAGKISTDDQNQPGTNTNITETTTPSTENTIGETSNIGGVISDGISTDVEGLLKTKDEPVTKEKLDMVDKVANAMYAVANKLAGEAVYGAFDKTASADGVGMIQKMASAGDPVAQEYMDYAQSYAYGLQKKAEDLEALGADPEDPEAVMAAEDALNQAAVEDPSAVMEDGEGCCGECEDGEWDDVEAAAGAEIEAAAQEAVIEVAGAILDQDPSISEEEAVMAAQEAVADAIDTIDAQQAIAAVDEGGEPMVDDATAADAVGEMAKSASAFPLRDAICAGLNARLGLSPAAFAQRIFG